MLQRAPTPLLCPEPTAMMDEKRKIKAGITTVLHTKGERE
jgi:hypothetical protein